jgi:hypothetical protein
MSKNSLIPQKMKMDDLARIAKIIQNPTTDLDAIDANDRDRILRMSAADDYLRLWKTKRKVVPMLLKKYPDMSKATGYRLINDTKKVFGPMKMSDKEGEIAYLYEEAHELLQLAKKAGNFMAADRHMNTMIKLAKLDADIDDHTADMIEAHINVIETDPTINNPNAPIYTDKQLSAFLSGFQTPKSKLKDSAIEIVNYEELDDEK